jgi:Ca2+-binding RTX toxin-like protein
MTSPFESGVVGTYPISGNAQIDPLVWLGYKWSASGAGMPAVVTYSFPTASSTWSNDYATFLDNEPFNNFEAFTGAQQTAAKQALALWSEVANITFQLVTETPANVGDIRFGNSGSVTQDPNSVAWAYTPYEDSDPNVHYPENGDVWFDKKYAGNLQLAPGKEGFATMLHEIGHALGLDHPFSDGEPGEPVLNPQFDTDQYTVMSYTPELSTQAYASTPQMLDILAIQYIYGANMTTRAGDTVYKFPAAAEVNKTIWDAGGIDTLDFTGHTRFVDGAIGEGGILRFGGSFATNTRSSLGIAYNVTIENIILGSGGGQIIGNSVANRMIGGNGADTFDGNGGDDHLEGRGGNDSLHDNYGNNWQDGGAGHDSLWSEDGNDTLLGGSGNDSIYAGKGDDLVDGGLGKDWLQGANGNDTYVLDSVGDQIAGEIYNWADTDDVARSSVTVNLVTLGEGAIEHAFLTGTLAINATGNDKDNELTGNAGANKLDGGIGADTMTGGKGGDTYVVNEAGDQIIEDIAGTAGGIDTVQSSTDFTLGANVEKLTLLASYGDIDGTGNTLNNTITGNEGANILNGAGGNDTLVGGQGSDVYIVDSLKDVVNETIANSKGGGIDTVQSAVTFSLATRANIDNLTLTGAADLNGTGNTLANTILGNSGKNVLDGGAGADVLRGGAGNDVYLLDNLADTVDEQGNADSADEVKTKVAIAAAFADVENYTYIGAIAWSFTGNELDNKISGGSAKDTLTGAVGNDTLLGNGGNDLLIGDVGDDRLDGGAGADTLHGGAGNDTYVVDNVGDKIDESANADTGDEIRSSLFVGLFAGIENYTYTGAKAWSFTGTTANNKLSGNTVNDTLKGAAGNDMLLGNGGNDLLIGEAGDDTLDGGAGNDKMLGGAGNDTYVINALTDIINEEGNADTDDVVRSSVTIDLTMAAFANIEHVELVGTAANATGDAGNNKITGNAAANLLIGGTGADTMDGGAGKDTLKGGADNDIYVLDDSDDTIDEEGNTDTDDLVRSSTSVNLTALAAGLIEHAELLGTAAINATGNAGDNKLTGNSGDNVLDGGDGADTMTGGLGNDTYIVDDAGDQIVDTGGVDLVKTDLTFSLASLGAIENLTLTGSSNTNATGNDLDNFLTGNSGANQLFGGLSADTLDGSSGADTLTGGSGNDVYIVDAGDQVVEAADGGTDTVKIDLTFSLAALVFVENLTLTGTSDIDATGNGLNNVLTGNDGVNLLNGGVGNDTMIGGKGDDTYLVDAAGDIISETVAVGGGTDLVESAVSFSLAAFANVENLKLTGSALNGAGNGLANVIIGTAASNILDGLGGADTLKGGAGNDTYVIDDAGDTVDEEGSADTDDLVRSSTTVNLTALAAGLIEHVELLGAVAIDATGNAGDNKLTGNSGDNELDGGVGADTLTGGLGNDTYAVDDAGDQVVEAAGGGTDLVKSNIDFTLAALAFVENVTLTGTSDIDVTGNALDNVLTGNDGVNLLDGGVGNDTMIGGKGDDTYLVDDIDDVISETFANFSLGGIDTVVANVTYSIAAVANVDNITLSGGAQANATGNGADNILTGNGSDNVLDGAAGADTLSGGGGSDTLRGGGGWDVYLIDADDVVDEQGGYADVWDEVRFSFLLASTFLGIEKYTYTGSSNWSFSGDSSSNWFTGGSGSDTLAGGAGDDLLDGGAGLDVLKGGSGNDTYTIDNAGDTIDEEGNTDTFDVVRATVSVNLATLAGGAIERAFLLGQDALNATGSGSNNTLTGNDGNNILDGGGGNDVLTGGKGDDTYVVDSFSDLIQEHFSNAEGGGIDTVISTLDFSIQDMGHLDNITLTGAQFGGVSATGNAGANVLTYTGPGYSYLNGLGGDDRLIGNSDGDFFNGGDGNDYVLGGGWHDNITGGAGIDVIDYNHVNELGDTIMDFKAGAGGDILDLHDLLADVGYSGSDPFGDGYLSYSYTPNAWSQLYFDADGKGSGSASVEVALLFSANLGQATAENYIF